MLCCSKDELGALAGIVAGCPTLKAFIVMDMDQEKPDMSLVEQVAP